MTEFKAHLLIFTAMLIVLTAVCFVLASMNAGGTAYGLAMILVGGAAAHVSSLVVMHYGSSEKHHRR